MSESVWIVWKDRREHVSDEPVMLGVFSAQDKAEAYCETFRGPEVGSKYYVCEHDVDVGS